MFYSSCLYSVKLSTKSCVFTHTDITNVTFKNNEVGAFVVPRKERVTTETACLRSRFPQLGPEPVAMTTALIPARLLWKACDSLTLSPYLPAVACSVGERVCMCVCVSAHARTVPHVYCNTRRS